ncbi:2-oxoacid:ferredoxin oxidoreductase subunit gamma [Desulfosporosinus burensis]
MARIECRITGFGGQGVILAGVVLGLAAILDGKNAAQTQSYGPEARGGAARSDVVFLDGEIDTIQVTKPNIIIAMSQEAHDKYLKGKAFDYAFIDSSIVQEYDRAPNVYALPITQQAVDELGSKVVANMVMLGFVNKIAKISSDDLLRTAVENSVPPKTKELNLRAVNLGLALAERREAENG